MKMKKISNITMQDIMEKCVIIIEFMNLLAKVLMEKFISANLLAGKMQKVMMSRRKELLKYSVKLIWKVKTLLVFITK